MADATPSAEYQRGDSLPYGEATSANAGSPQMGERSSFADLLTGEGFGGPDQQQFAPQNDAESYLFSPSDRPNEPLFAGAPTGPGPDFSKQQMETDQDFMNRVAAQLGSQPDALPDVKQFARRVLEGL